MYNKHSKHLQLTYRSTLGLGPGLHGFSKLGDLIRRSWVMACRRALSSWVDREGKTADKLVAYSNSAPDPRGLLSFTLSGLAGSKIIHVHQIEYALGALVHRQMEKEINTKSTQDTSDSPLLCDAWKELMETINHWPMCEREQSRGGGQGVVSHKEWGRGLRIAHREASWGFKSASSFCPLSFLLLDDWQVSN